MKQTYSAIRIHEEECKRAEIRAIKRILELKARLRARGVAIPLKLSRLEKERE